MIREDALNAFESLFFHVESEQTPMNIGSLAIYDGNGWRDRSGRLRLAALRKHIRSRLCEIPRLLQHPVWPPASVGRPHWVDDPSFEIGRHVLVRHLRAPVSESRLLSEVEDLHMGLLDRAHPLWQLWFIDGLDSGRVAVVEKLHHALADGIGGVDIAMMLLDPTPTYRRPVADPHPLRKEPSPLALLGSAALAAGEVPLEVGRGMLSTAAHPLKSTAGAARLAAAAGSVLADPLAPRCSLNANVGAHRRYRVIRLSFDAVHDTAHALGGTVNDVVLSAVGAGLDTLFASRHEDLNGRKVHALVPVSLRGEHEHRSLGNRVAAMLVALPAGNLDAEQRFAATKAAAGAARRHQQVALSSAVLNLPEYWPEWMLAASSGLAHHQPVFNLVVTNIPGPPEPLYLMGAKLFEVFPVVPLTRNATISVGILSYDHRLTVGLWADRDRFPDLDVLARGIERGFLATAQPARLQRSARR